MADWEVTLWFTNGQGQGDHIASKSEHQATLCGKTVPELPDDAFLVRFPNEFPIPRPDVQDLCPDCKDAADFDFEAVES